MALIDLYPQVRLAHIGLVVASGTLFAARGAAVLAGARWAMTAAVRRLSQVIDSALLGAALLLLAALQLNPFVVPWLATKLALLLVYIVLGTFALRRARTPAARAACYVAALAVFAFMLGVAVAHHPLGVFARLSSPLS